MNLQNVSTRVPKSLRHLERWACGIFVLSKKFMNHLKMVDLLFPLFKAINYQVIKFLVRFKYR